MVCCIQTVSCATVLKNVVALSLKELYTSLIIISNNSFETFAVYFMITLSVANTLKMEHPVAVEGPNGAF